MMRRRLLAAALLPLMLSGATKPVLVPDVSARSVEIRYSFTGAQLLLFGAILYPGGRVPADPADIVVVLKGPVQPIIVREKQKIAGIWMNADSSRFREVTGWTPSVSMREGLTRTLAFYRDHLDRYLDSPAGRA